MKEFHIAGLGDYQAAAKELIILGSSRPSQVSKLYPLFIEEKPFPDGEIYHRIITELRNKHVILFCGTHNDQHFMHLLDVACACSKLGAQSLTLLIPYFGYSTMERSTMTGEVIKAKVRARMLSAIPQAKEGNSILFLDLHADGIPQYLEGDTHGFHIYSEELITRTISHLVDLSSPRPNVCIGSTDTGRSKWVQSLAKRLGLRAVTAQKTRHSGEEVSLDDIEGSFNGETVVIYDDMIRTGGSLIQAARGYRDKGAGKILAITTHGVLPGKSLTRLLEEKYKGEPLIETIVSTDSMPHVHGLKKALPEELEHRFEVISSLPLWLDGIDTYL